MKGLNKKRILVITDSLGLPRKDSSGNIGLDNTWPYILRNEYEVFQISLLGETIKYLFDKSLPYSDSYFDYIIIQSGIVDCSPRAISKREKYLIENIPFVGRIFYPLLKKHKIKLREKRDITYTKIEDYKKYIINFKETFKTSKLIFISILPANNEYEKIVPGIQKNILLFNECLKSYAPNLIEYDLELDNIYTSDLHHLNVKGNYFLYNKVKSKLND